MHVVCGMLSRSTVVAVALLLCLCTLFPTEALVTDPAEVNALGDIKSRLIDPLRTLTSWNRGDPCRSRWLGIECFNQSAKDGYAHIKELHLLNLNLSGTLSPALGQLSYLEILDFMWNNIHGTIPKEISRLTNLKLLLLSGNQLSGSLPDELGYLANLDRLQIDENKISGPFPISFANMTNIRHLHMNNNSISGQIPPELGKLPKLVHFLIDNNELSGYLPPELSESPSLIILQLDNNNLNGSSIPQSYGKLKNLVKLSLRNCSLRGTVPDLSNISNLTYVDLSWNHLEGSIPYQELSTNMTTIDLSNNNLNGSIPLSYSKFPFLQKLSLKNNLLSGSIPSIWENVTFTANSSLILDFQNNSLSSFLGSYNPQPTVKLMLQGNPICSGLKEPDILKFCGTIRKEESPAISSDPINVCLPQSCPKESLFEYIPASPVPCYCAAPIGIGYRLKSPGFSDFQPYRNFSEILAHDVGLLPYQIFIDSLAWEEGPRLRMYLKIFPNLFPVFNDSEVFRIIDMFADWKIRNKDIFGPYELLNLTLLGPYSHLKLGLFVSRKKSVMLPVILAISCAAILSIFIVFIIMRRQLRYQYLTSSSKRCASSNSRIEVDGVKQFSFGEVSVATASFSTFSQIGKGGYGKVYKGIFPDGKVVAVKRSQEGSFQGSKEFCNEIEFLSRLHHRNLVSLIGYCDEGSEQMLIYEFMSNGTLRDHLSGRSNKSLDFSTRLQIALGSARGILYLHNEVDPPIFHRDIKASNILLDSKFIPKVADFGLSRCAPVPDDNGEVNGHISTVVRGTPGYIDPEYFLTHKLTDKSDVYSLGVVFLELLTGMHPISHGKNIVREARTAFQHNRISSIMDERLNTYPQCSAARFMLLALRCCDGDHDARPSIREVVRELEDICLTAGVDSSQSESTVTDSSEVHSEYSVSGDLQKSSLPSEYSVSGDLRSWSYETGSDTRTQSTTLPHTL